jgi:hypothetical protein
MLIRRCVAYNLGKHFYQAWFSLLTLFLPSTNSCCERPEHSHSISACLKIVSRPSYPFQSSFSLRGGRRVLPSSSELRLPHQHLQSLDPNEASLVCGAHSDVFCPHSFMLHWDHCHQHSYRGLHVSLSRRHQSPEHRGTQPTYIGRHYDYQ